MASHLIIDEDILIAAAELALDQNRSVGEVISALARSALQTPGLVKRNGIPLLPKHPGGLPVSMELVKRLQDDAE